MKLRTWECITADGQHQWEVKRRRSSRVRYGCNECGALEGWTRDPNYAPGPSHTPPKVREKTVHESPARVPEHTVFDGRTRHVIGKGSEAFDRATVFQAIFDARTQFMESTGSLPSERLAAEADEKLRTFKVVELREACMLLNIAFKSAWRKDEYVTALLYKGA